LEFPRNANFQRDLASSLPQTLIQIESFKRLSGEYKKRLNMPWSNLGVGGIHLRKYNLEYLQFSMLMLIFHTMEHM
jgi:hypothetical protein